MPATYSILPGELTESTRLTDIYSVLNDIPDNSQKLISPRDIRNAILSTWSNSSFKLTSVGTNEYIGVDSNNPEDRDIKSKILLGKRSVGTFNVMSDSLINNSDSDIFIYNTKQDTESQDITKVSFLAGTFSNLFESAPFLKSERIDDAIDFTIQNPQSSINIISNFNRVSINNISFPRILDSQLNAVDGKILKYAGVYPFGKLEWSDPVIDNTQIGSSSSITNINGSDVYLNNYSLEFIEDRQVPDKIGDIQQGESFPSGSFNGQNWPLSEIMRRIIYPYIEPEVSLSVFNSETGGKFVEVGAGNGLIGFLDTPTLKFIPSITTYNRDSNEGISEFIIRDNGILNNGTWNIIENIGPFNSEPGDTFTFSYVKVYDEFGDEPKSVDFGAMISNINPSISNVNLSTIGLSYSSVDTIKSVLPFITGISNNLYALPDNRITNFIKDNTLNRYLLGPQSDGDSFYADVPAGIGYFYFGHPDTYGTLKYIKDPNGFIIYEQGLSASSFESFEDTPNAPLDYYGRYVVYRTETMIDYDGVGKFEFIFL